MKRVIFVILAVMLTVPVLAQNSALTTHILSFSKWKSQQITDADNRVARISNSLTLLRQQKSSKPSEINKLETEVRVSKNAAQAVRDLTIEDYFNVYLSQYLRDPGVLESAAQTLTPQEVTLLLKIYLSSRELGNQASI